MTKLDRRAAAAAACFLLALVLGGCEEVKERYGPRTIVAPRPVGADAYTPGALAGAPLRPSGAIALSPERTGRALATPEVVTGTGGPSPAGPSELIRPEFGQPVTLNFVDTDLREVVDTVLGQILGRNYAIDSRVEGRVTTRTTQPIARNDVYDVLLNLLAANGATIVDDGAVATVVPISVAREMPRVVVTAADRPQQRGFGTYFIPVRQGSAASIRETIAGQLGPGSQIALDPSGRILVFTGPERDARAIEEMVRVLDVDVLAGRSFALLPLEAATPREVAAEIGAILTGSGDAPGAGGHVLPVERINAVLAVADSPGELRELAGWVRRLDRADAGQQASLFVYYLRAGRASDLAATLSAVFGADSSVPVRTPGRVIAPGLRPTAIGAVRREDAAGVTRPVPAAADPLDVFAEADPTLGDIEQPGFEPSFAFSEAPLRPELRIVPDDARNAIIVHGGPDELRIVREALARLDVEPTQILIEATIAEVTLNDDLEYGVRWAFETGDFSGSFTDSTLGIIGRSFPGLNLVLDTSEAIAVLSALAQVTNVEVISSPQLMVLENQPARLQVGDQVPILTRSIVDIDSLDAVANEIAYVDTGVILEVTPRVNADGLVAMEVVQEVSDAVEPLVEEIPSPTLQQRRINSTVAVRSGQTIVLGGLIRERQENGRIGIPLLMDIPVLGNIFRTTSRTGTRTELLVMITPRVVRDSYEAESLTNQLRDRLTELGDILQRP